MNRTCEACRWWQKQRAGAEPICSNVDSDNRFDETEAEIEQDGDVTWTN